MLIAVVAAFGACNNERGEADLSKALFENLESLRTKNVETADSAHEKLYNQAISLEQQGHLKELNINRIIAGLCLRRAMLKEMGGHSDLVPPFVAEARARYERDGIIPADKPLAERDALFRELVTNILSVERPAWSAELIARWEASGVLSASNPELLARAKVGSR